MSEREIRLRKQMRGNFEDFARKCLKIRTKSGEIRPLVLNRAQRHVLQKMREQEAATGKVRVNVLKGRQQGISTLIEAWFYWKTIHRKGVRSFILTHGDEATKNLFEMVERFHTHNNPLLKPRTGIANAKELVFSKLDSGYKVGTAGNKTVGRSQTIQLFHGSEVGFWQNATEHAKGVLQAIPNAPGTASVLESTANGVGNYFHQRWKMAERGEGDAINVFVPWFWQEEYRERVPAGGIKLTDDEQDLVDAYELDHEQILWRRKKIAELSVEGGDGEASFKQEYPCNAAEAFQMSGQIGLITAKWVVRARKADIQPAGPYIVGVDPSRGGDRFSTIKRMGRKSWGVKSWGGIASSQTNDQEVRSASAVDTLGKQVAIVKKILDFHDPVAGKKPDMVFIDAGGGDALVDRLHELGYKDRVSAVNFGMTALDPERYTNKRNEMWGELNAWLTDEALPVEIDDADSLQADLCASLYRRDAHDRKVLYSKEYIKDKLGFSPDEGDALALTFAFPVILEKKREHNIADYMSAQGAGL